MGATTHTAFDPKPRALNSIDMIAGETILAGALVGFADSGGSWTVVNATTSTSAPVGIALYSATTNDHVSVATVGSVVKMELSTDNGTADAGDGIANSAAAGCVIVGDFDATAEGTEGTGTYPVGIAMEDISAGTGGVGGKGYVLITLGCQWTVS